MRSPLVRLAAAAALLVACSQDLGIERRLFACTQDGQCAPGFVCVQLSLDPPERACLPVDHDVKLPEPDTLEPAVDAVTDAGQDVPVIPDVDEVADPGPDETLEDAPTADDAPAEEVDPPETRGDVADGAEAEDADAQLEEDGQIEDAASPLDDALVADDAVLADDADDGGAQPECITGEDCLAALGVHAACNQAACKDGQCVYTLHPQPECDDDDPCTEKDRCVNGECKGDPFTCTVDDPKLFCLVPECLGGGENHCAYTQTAGTCLFMQDTTYVECYRPGEAHRSIECRVCAPNGLAVTEFAVAEDGTPCADGAGTCQGGDCIVPD